MEVLHLITLEPDVPGLKHSDSFVPASVHAGFLEELINFVHPGLTSVLC